MNKQYYTKEGDKYVKSNDPLALDGLDNGVWIVIVKNGSKLIRRKLSTKNIEIVGSLEYLHEGLCHAMFEAGTIKPSSTLLSDKEKKAWKAYKKIMGKDMPSLFSYPSYSDIANAGCEYIKGILLENNCNVSKIKKKYGNLKYKEVINAIDRLEI